MAVTDTTDKITEAGNGSKTTFSFPFKIFKTSDLVVYNITTATGVAVGPLTLGVDYTATINAVTEGGTVTYTVAPSTAQQSFVKRVVDLKQECIIPTEGVFPEETIENQLDKNVMMIIQISEAVDRALKVPVTSSAVIVLPTPLDGYSLAWDGNGGTLKNVLIDADAIAAQVAIAQAAALAAAASQATAAANATTASGQATAAAASAAAAAASAASLVGIAFQAMKSAVQSLADATATKITWDTVNANAGGYFATSRFTPLKAGNYHISAVGSINSLPSDKSWLLFIYKNGAPYLDITNFTAPSAGTGGACLSAVIPMNGTTDYVEIYAQQNSGGALNFGAGISSMFSGFLIN